ncbi:MAG: hypothetical protein K0Q63_3589, partial [Paenibacillus sp.]|nr:hypothetical protein [Paenibacillus sp.]
CVESLNVSLPLTSIYSMYMFAIPRLLAKMELLYGEVG